MLVSGFKSIPSNSRFPASPTLFTLASSWLSVEGSLPTPKYLFTIVSQCVCMARLFLKAGYWVPPETYLISRRWGPGIRILTTVPVILVLT